MRKIPPLLLVCLLLSACTKEAVSPASRESPKPASMTGLRQLALQEIGGETAVDRRIQKMQAWVTRDPGKLDAWILLGRAWVQKARQASDPSFYLNANAAADVALELKPQSPLAMNLKGLVLMNDHRFQEAKVLSRKILDIDPDDLMALGVLSDASIELGEIETALEVTQKMVDLKPNLPSYARASYLRWLQGDTPGALTIIRQAIDAGGDPNDREPLAWVLVEAGKLFHHRGDYEGAIAGYDQALIVFENHPPALVWKAKALLALGRAEEARILAARSYQESALAETAWVWADAANAAGKTAEAMTAYAKLVKLGHQGERRALALYYATRSERVEDAVALASAELKGRKDIYTWDAYAWALYRADRIDEAQAAIAEAVRWGTQDARLLYHQGAIMIRAGQAAAGKAKIEEALRLNPKFDWFEAREARQALRS